MICDFCLRPCAEAWSFQVAGFYEPEWRVINKPGEWAACDGCAPFIVARDLEGLIARVHANVDIEQNKTRLSYALIFTHIKGEPGRFTDADFFPFIIICGDGEGDACDMCARPITIDPERAAKIERGSIPLCIACGVAFFERWGESGRPVESAADPRYGHLVVALVQGMKRSRRG